MRRNRVRRHQLIAAAAGGLLAAAVAAAVAYATIPGDGTVYTACMLKNVGTVRLIDPSLPSGNVMSHCTSLEAQVSWNQKGQPGLPGKDGTNGHDGAACAPTNPACVGPKGDKGDTGPQGPAGVFTGTLTSPNGAYSISVTDTGIVLTAPGARARLVGDEITLESGGSTTVQAGTTFDPPTRGGPGPPSGGGPTPASRPQPPPRGNPATGR